MCRAALAADPAYSDALHLLGVVALRTARLDEAVDLLRRAIRARPAFPDAYNNLGVALEARGQLVKAENAYRAALRLDGRQVGAWDNLGNVLKKAGRPLEALEAYRQALWLRPDDPVAHSGLGTAHLELARVPEAVGYFRRSCELQLANAAARSDLLYTLHYDDGMDAEALYREHVLYPCRAGVPPAQPNPQAGRLHHRLRVGYVSPDLRDHTVTRFIGGALARHDREAFEVFLYSDAVRADATSERIKGLGHAWRDCAALSDEQLFELIRSDRIDVLVDLRGHGAGNRLPMFARKPAPVQVTMVGYFDTTGLPQMDWRVTDGWMDPPGASERFHTEKLLRLPGGCWCYSPDKDAPEVAQPPAQAADHVTFGSLNKVAKVSPLCARLWAQVLEGVPGSRLLLSVAGDGPTREAVRGRLAEMGLPADRLDFADKTPTRRGYLETFNRIDVALDPFPFNGITTTCDGLWMGVPAVSLAGNTSVSRAGRSILHGAGLPELAADTPEQFVATAAGLAGDVDRLRELRLTMRERLAASPLLDAQRFTRELEGAYREMCHDATLAV
jgi:predicted O-linked N-acetylglucosamine transferase (SPINDLY family)